MGCNCGRQATRREIARTSALPPTRDGGYALRQYPGCTSLHAGQWAGESTYVVGRATEHERLFKRADIAEMTTYALATKQSVENIPNTGLCDQAITDLYG